MRKGITEIVNKRGEGWGDVSDTDNGFSQPYNHGQYDGSRRGVHTFMKRSYSLKKIYK